MRRVCLPSPSNGKLLLELDGPVHDVLTGFVNPVLKPHRLDQVLDFFLLLDEYVHLVSSFTEQAFLHLIEDIGACLLGDP